jgi:hypothetical protein
LIHEIKKKYKKKLCKKGYKLNELKIKHKKVKLNINPLNIKKINK